jgi:hypothetical protein
MLPEISCCDGQKSQFYLVVVLHPKRQLTQSSPNAPALMPGHFSISRSFGRAWRMTKSEDFRIYAAECEKIASEATDPDTKRRFNEMAADWKQWPSTFERRGNKIVS